MELPINFGRIFLLIVLVLNPDSRGWPDGGYVSKTTSIAISTDQRAILIQNGNEISMVLSTGYTGEGQDFGWIIPTPVPPAIEDMRETDEVLFEFLDKITAPIEVQYTSSGCLPARTAVLTADGLSPIERVSPGTGVYACDFTAAFPWITVVDFYLLMKEFERN